MKLNIPRLSFFSSSQLRDIHEATLELLERTGVVFKHAEALKILEDAGATVDHKSQRVFFPSHLVEDQVRKAPSRFTWYARDPGKSVRFEDGMIHFGPVCTPVFIYELGTYRRRYATLNDFENVVKLMHSLDRVDDGYGAVNINDVPIHAAHAHALLAQLRNTDKCVRGRARGTSVARDCVTMMAMLSGEEELARRPMLLCMVNSTSPLQWDKPMIEGMMEYVRLGQIVAPSPEIMAGATGPVTLAGMMTQHNAEVLSMITLMQLVNPGTPTLYGAVSTVMDMKTCTTRLGSPELGITHVGFAQLAKSYNIPCRGAAGSADSKALDIQAGYETTFNLMLATCAGFNYVTYAFGGMDSSNSVSYEKILTDHELLGMIERMATGVEVTDETIALDVVDAVGPGGHFLASAHTRNYHEREHFIPKLFETRPYDSWVAAGSREIRERATQEVNRILRDHHPPELDKRLSEKLEQYVKDVERREIVAV
jgi:trimethylamine--corrinoid protein Co-methyltransferase